MLVFTLNDNNLQEKLGDGIVEKFKQSMANLAVSVDNYEKAGPIDIRASERPKEEIRNIAYSQMCRDFAYTTILFYAMLEKYQMSLQVFEPAIMYALNNDEVKNTDLATVEHLTEEDFINPELTQSN